MSETKKKKIPNISRVVVSTSPTKTKSPKVTSILSTKKGESKTGSKKKVTIKIEDDEEEPVAISPVKKIISKPKKIVSTDQELVRPKAVISSKPSAKKNSTTEDEKPVV